MKFKKLLLASATCFAFANGVSFAQSNYGCFTDEHQRELELKYPGETQRREAIELQIQQIISQRSNQKVNAGILKVPVVLHIVTESGLNGMSKAQAENGIQVLNEDFRRLNADASSTRAIFQPYAADFEVEFALAKLDPNGEPTEGLVRTTSNTTNGPVTRDNVKLASPAWDPSKYFNVWVVRTINSDNALGGGTILGYAQFPGTGGAAGWNTYGVVLLQSNWGKQGAVPGSLATSDGRTATHEVGHCFNLYHTFQGSCGSTNHTNSGDGVGDTPPSLEDRYNCSFTQNTCSNDVGTGSPYTSNVPDQIENYMSYNSCQNMFTTGQKNRALAAIALYPQLTNLTSANNAIVTGIDPSVSIGQLKPQPYFAISSNRVCAGSTVAFTDASYNGNVTSWFWEFPGGTPSTSNLQNPIVTYDTPGLYEVKLTAGNFAGSRLLSQPDLIKVIPVIGLTVAANGLQFQESFEGGSFPVNSDAAKTWERYTDSFVGGSANWERTNTASINGAASLRLRNSSIAAGTISTLITPNIDVTGMSSSLNYSFNLAYAAKNTTPAEEFRVYTSTDCGANWQLRYTAAGNALVCTGCPVVTSTFTPNNTQWLTINRLIANSQITGGKIMFKIEAESNGGNNLYIDNFRVYSNVLGQNEELAQANNITLFPNPVTSETGVNFDLKKAENVSLKIYDLVGNVVYIGKSENLAAGAHTIKLQDKLKTASAGMYMVQLTFGNKVYNTKLINQ